MALNGSPHAGVSDHLPRSHPAAPLPAWRGAGTGLPAAGNQPRTRPGALGVQADLSRGGQGRLKMPFKKDIEGQERIQQRTTTLVEGLENVW